MTFRKVFIRLFAPTLALAFAAASAGCSHNKQAVDGLDDVQKAKLLNAAEAFYESGGDYKKGDAMTNTQLETFVYYLYNDELTPVRNGFGTVSMDEGDALLNEIFGFAPVIHKNYNTDGSSPFYSVGENYYVKVDTSEPAASEIRSIEKREDGDYDARIVFTSADGSETHLTIVCSVVDGGIRILQCNQYANK